MTRKGWRRTEPRWITADSAKRTVVEAPLDSGVSCKSGRLRSRVLLGVCLLMTNFGLLAQAPRPIIVVPAQPVAGERIEVAFDSNACELIVDGPSDVDIVRTGFALDVVVDGRVNVDPLFCMVTPSRPRFVVGTLAPGRYTVRIIIREFLPPFFLNPPSAEGTLVVSAAPVPSLRLETMVLLSVLILIGGCLAMTRDGTCRFTARRLGV